MEQDAQVPISTLRADGGPTRNTYLMQFQSDIAGVAVQVPDAEELSGIGAAYMAGISLGIFDNGVFEHVKYQSYSPKMDIENRERKYKGWKSAVEKVLTK